MQDWLSEAAPQPCARTRPRAPRGCQLGGELAAQQGSAAGHSDSIRMLP